MALSRLTDSGYSREPFTVVEPALDTERLARRTPVERLRDGGARCERYRWSHAGSTVVFSLLAAVTVRIPLEPFHVPERPTDRFS